VAEYVDKHCPGKEDVSHGTVIDTLVLNRLMAPKPMPKVGEWVTETVLEDTLGVSAKQMYDNRLGRTPDDLHPHLEAIWQDIVIRAIVDYDVALCFLHYDITSIYFECVYEASEKVSYGLSRDHRADTKQVNLAANVTSKTGIPLGYRVLAGRIADRTTHVENLEALRALLNRPKLALRQKDFLLVSNRAMLDRKRIIAYQAKTVHWLRPVQVNGELSEVLRSVPDEELAAHPLAYQTRNQPKEEPFRYQGVFRSSTIEYEGQTVPIQVLVVKSRTKVKLDQERSQASLKRLTDRLEKIQVLNTRRSTFALCSCTKRSASNRWSLWP